MASGEQPRSDPQLWRMLIARWLPRRQLTQVSLQELLLVGTALTILIVTFRNRSSGQFAYFNACGGLGGITLVLIAMRLIATRTILAVVLGAIGGVASVCAAMLLQAYFPSLGYTLSVAEMFAVGMGSGTLMAVLLTFAHLQELTTRPVPGKKIGKDDLRRFATLFGSAILLLIFYCVAYLALVQRMYPTGRGTFSTAPTRQLYGYYYSRPPGVVRYRFGGEVAETFFAPMYSLDRRIRQDYWKDVPPP